MSKSFDDVQVIVVADNDEDVPVRTIPPGILQMLGPTTILMSNDNVRCYVRKSHWDAMKDSFKLFEG